MARNPVAGMTTSPHIVVMRITRLRFDLKRARDLFFAAALAFGAGCTALTPEPGPEAQEAAKRLSSDIAKYREVDARKQMARDADDIVLGANLFAEVYEQVQRHYVREVNEDRLIAAATNEIRKRHPKPSGAPDAKLVEAAIHGMLGSLDNYSVYLDTAHLKALREETRGRFGGLGVEVKKGDKYIHVVSPIDGTPAAKAGLKPGDRIIRADGKSLEGLLLRDAVLLLRGAPGSKVVLAIKRGKREPFDVTIERAVIDIAVVRWRAEGDIGYLRVASFSERAGPEVASALHGIKREMGRRLRGVVVDLRSNPGGLLDQSIRVSDMFLDSGRIVSTRERSFEHHYNATAGDLLDGLPIVVLINNGSASAAEIVAGALKDHRRAALVGKKTFGKGTVQTIIPLSRRDAVKLTTAVYLTPSGHSVDGGIEPDFDVGLDEKREGDEQLELALKILNARTAAASGQAVSR